MEDQNTQVIQIPRYNVEKFFMVPHDKILYIPGEDYQRNYDVDMLKDVENDYKGSSYITWSKVYKWFQVAYPHLHLDIIRNFSDGSIVEYFTDKQNTSVIYFYFICSKTGKQSLPYSYPVRGTKPGAIINPKSNDIEYAINRGRVKAIAVFTGYGFRLWGGDDLEVEKSPMIERIIELGKEYKNLTKNDYPNIQEVGLGMRLQDLKSFGLKLKQELEDLVKAKTK